MNIELFIFMFIPVFFAACIPIGVNRRVITLNGWKYFIVRNLVMSSVASLVVMYILTR